MRLIRFDGLKAVPWKNGGGATTELAAFPEGAAFDGFEWRISVADIAVEGPFSRFDGVDRILTLASGGELELTLDGAVVRLDEKTPSLAFPGEAAVYARLSAGPVRDINVMTRRGLWRASVARLSERSPPAGAEILIAVALRACELEVERQRIFLAPFDALVAGPDDLTVAAGGHAAAHALLICLEGIDRSTN